MDLCDPALPNELSSVNQGHIYVEKDRLTVRYTGEGRHSNNVGAIQANKPIPANRLLYYFEVTVKDQGAEGRIGIGFSDKHFKLNRQPGWEPNSYGYHGDDGSKFSGSGEKGEDYGPKFGTGDTVGAGIHLGKQEIFFTLNGMKLKTAFRGIKTSQLYPTIGLHSKNEVVEVNFGKRPFRFDLEGLIADERAAQQAAVDRVSLPTTITHQVVRQYLKHYGYADTLAAFDEASGISSSSEASPASTDDASKLVLRQRLRRGVVSGDIPSVFAQLQQHFPQVLQPGFEEVSFYLSCQTYIEHLRAGRVEAAVAYAQTVLAGLRASAAGALEHVLREVVALVAYESPASSPLAHLMSLQQRELVADVVNNAVLVVVSGAGPGQGPGGPGGVMAAPCSALESALKQLVCVQGMAHELNGGMGEVFDLAAHLLPTPAVSGASQPAPVPHA